MTYLESYIRVIDGRREFDIRWGVRVRSREIDEDLELESGVYSALNSANVTCPTCHGAVVYWKGRAAGCTTISVLRLNRKGVDGPGGDIMTKAIGRTDMSGGATEQAVHSLSINSDWRRFYGQTHIRGRPGSHLHSGLLLHADGLRPLFERSICLVSRCLTMKGM